MNPAEAARAALARAALAEIPKLLTLQDRTPSSPTYGCFDRAYWHYRMMDFPCGMSQEFVLPLALAWALPMPDNPYHRQPAVRDWVEAGIRYAARSAHPDGSCDDYYPFERAAGAAAFSLLAAIDAARVVGVAEDPEIAAFLHRRARWLADHRESGRLSNHEALIVAALARLAPGAPAFEAALRERAARLLSWQHAEGWFDEYGGADPGYLSLTVGLLADVDRLRPDLGLRAPCGRAIDFLCAMAHPDGTIGGEYTSRATRNFFPHGLEIAAAWHPRAAALNALLLRPLAEGRAPCFADDHIVGHHLWSWMLAWRDWRDGERAALPLAEGRARFDGARLLVEAAEGTRLYCGWSRGGAFKLFAGERLLASDTGPSLVTRGGRVAVTHLDAPDAAPALTEDALVVEGRMAWAKSARLTPARSIVLRSVMLTLGRFFPDTVRRLLQRVLVTGRKDAPFRYRRELRRDGAGWTVTDTVTPEAGWADVRGAGIGGFQTSVTTIMARVWQEEQFQPWHDLSEQLAALSGDAPLVVTRRFGGEAA